LVVGTIGMLASFFFLSAQHEKQLPLLLGALAALSAVSRNSAAAMRPTNEADTRFLPVEPRPLSPRFSFADPVALGRRTRLSIRSGENHQDDLRFNRTKRWVFSTLIRSRPSAASHDTGTSRRDRGGNRVMRCDLDANPGNSPEISFGLTPRT
jgi:hypothetical protein